MTGPSEFLFTISTVGKLDPKTIRVERPFNVDPDDQRAVVWLAGHTRLMFESAEDVELFVQTLLDRLTDLQYGEAQAAKAYRLRPFADLPPDADLDQVLAEYTPEQLALGRERLMAAIDALPPTVETIEVTGDVL